MNGGDGRGAGDIRVWFLSIVAGYGTAIPAGGSRRMDHGPCREGKGPVTYFIFAAHLELSIRIYYDILPISLINVNIELNFSFAFLVLIKQKHIWSFSTQIYDGILIFQQIQYQQSLRKNLALSGKQL